MVGFFLLGVLLRGRLGSLRGCSVFGCQKVGDVWIFFLGGAFQHCLLCLQSLGLTFASRGAGTFFAFGAALLPHGSQGDTQILLWVRLSCNSGPRPVVCQDWPSTLWVQAVLMQKLSGSCFCLHSASCSFQKVPPQMGLRLLTVTPLSPGLTSLTGGPVADGCRDSGGVPRACTMWWGCPWSLGTCGGAPSPVPERTSLGCPPQPGGQCRVGLLAQPSREQYLHRREAPAVAQPSSTGSGQGTPGSVGPAPAALRVSSQTAPYMQRAFRTVSQKRPVGTEH